MELAYDVEAAYRGPSGDDERNGNKLYSPLDDQNLSYTFVTFELNKFLEQIKTVENQSARLKLNTMISKLIKENQKEHDLIMT